MIQFADNTTRPTRPPKRPRPPQRKPLPQREPLHRLSEAATPIGRLPFLAAALAHRRRPATKSARMKQRRLQVLEKYDFHCQLCGRDLLSDLDTLLNASVDHLVPKAAGGTGAMENLIAACKSCNSLKGSAPTTTIEEARQFVAERRASMSLEFTALLNRRGVKFPRSGRALGRQITLDTLAGMVDGSAETLSRVARLLDLLIEDDNALQENVTL